MIEGASGMTMIMPWTIIDSDSKTKNGFSKISGAEQFCPGSDDIH
jgi:hypothetical protein